MGSQSKSFGAHDISSGLSYFKNQIEAALTQARKDLEEIEKGISQRKIVDKSLSDLPKKIKHSIMVPFGRVAFFPGKLVHTNEVLVDVGCGIMIECSASHAQGINTRRIARLEEEKKDLNGTIQALQKQVDDCKTQEEEGIIDIVEDYDESVHGSYPDRSTERCPKRDILPAVEEECASSLPEGDSDEELFKMMDKMAELEAQSEARGETKIDEDRSSIKQSILKGSDKRQPKAHKPILRKGFLLEKKIHKPDVQKTDGAISKDTQSVVRLQDRGVVERTPSSSHEVGSKHPEVDKVDPVKSCGSVSKFKQRMLEQRKK